MAKKEKKTLTPEEYSAKLEKKKDRRCRFSKVFFKALALFLGCAIVYSTSVIAFTRTGISKGGEVVANNANTSTDTSGSSSDDIFNDDNTADNTADTSSDNTADTSSDNTADNTDSATDTATPADTSSSSSSSSSGSSNSSSSSQGNSSSSSSSNSTESILKEFNDAINKVKSTGKITRVSGGTKNNGGIDESSQLPGVLKSVGNSVINSALSSNGVKEDGSQIEASAFPVENQSYSSKLTTDDIVSAQKSGNKIRIVIKDDELGQADNGHCAKAMNVIKSSVIMGNIPSVASSFASEAKTSAKNGTIIVTLDNSGRVVAADYSFNWDIEIIGNSLDAIIHLASEDHYTIAY